jgi:signal transduction histidine kinase
MQPESPSTTGTPMASGPTGNTTCMEIPPFPPELPSLAEVASMRAERALLSELLAAPPLALSRFTGTAMSELRALRGLVAKRAREPAEFRRKLRALHRRCARIARRGLQVPVPQLAYGFEAAARAFASLAAARDPDGDDFLPLQESLDHAIMNLALVALRTGAQPPTRRRAYRALVNSKASARRPGASGQAPQVALALQQLAERIAQEQGKRVELSLLGLEHLPVEMSGAVFDICSQLLRNAIGHGLEVPARRSEAGKPAAGQVLVEFKLRDEGRAELTVQDDGIGMSPDRLMKANARQSDRGRGMAIVGQRVRGLRGQLQVASRRGKYTRVRVRIPMPGAVRPGVRAVDTGNDLAASSGGLAAGNKTR